MSEHKQDLDQICSILNALPGGVYEFRVHPDGRQEFTYMSANAERILGTTVGELATQQSEDNDGRFSAEDWGQIGEAIAKSARNLSQFEWEGRVSDPATGYKWVRFQSMPRQLADGTIVWAGQLLDVTKEVELREQLKKASAERDAQKVIVDEVLAGIPDGVCVCDASGKFLAWNDAAAALTGFSSDEASRTEKGEWSDSYGLFRTDGVTPYPQHELPLSRALGGEKVLQDELLVRNAQVPQGAVLSVSATPVFDEHGKPQRAIAIFRDVTSQRRLEEQIQDRNQQLEESEAAKIELIERLRLAVDELSTPILEVAEHVLALPMIGVVDSRRAAQVMERLLEAVVDKQAQVVIVDVTGVEVIDTKTADYFIKLMRAVELLGAQCLVSGIRPAVAQALVDLGLELAHVRTTRNLRTALRDSLGQDGQAGRAAPARARGAA